MHKTVRVRPGAEKLHVVWARGLVAPQGKRIKKTRVPDGTRVSPSVARIGRLGSGEML